MVRDYKKKYYIDDNIINFLVYQQIKLRNVKINNFDNVKKIKFL